MENCDFNKVTPDQAITFYRSMKKDTVKLLNQLSLEQFTSFEDSERFHDEFTHPFEDGGYEAEAQARKEMLEKKRAEGGEAAEEEEDDLDM